VSNKIKKEVELSEEFIVLAIPASTVEVTISAKVWHDGAVVEVKRTMPFDEVRDAIKEAKEGYIPSDALFVLNPDISKSKLEQLVQSYLDRAEDSGED
jgi:hypothetical protein